MVTGITGITSASSVLLVTRRYRSTARRSSFRRDLPANAVASAASHVEIERMPDIAERALARLRRMSPAEKLRVAASLWREAQRVTRAAVRQRHPDWSAEAVERETRRLMSGGRA